MADPDTLDAGEIANALTLLLDEPGFAHAAQRLATEIQPMPGPEQTADFLEQLAGNQPGRSNDSSVRSHTVVGQTVPAGGRAAGALLEGP